MASLNVAAIDKAVADHVEVRFEKLRDDIRERINAMGLRASGATGRSLKVVVTGNEVALWGRKFFASLQYGSKPWSGTTGIRCTFEAFRDIIRQWASDKGLNFGQAKEHERTIGAITATIIRRGSRLYRNGAYQDVYDTLIAEAVKDVNTILLTEVGTAFDIAINQWARLSNNITI